MGSPHRPFVCVAPIGARAPGCPEHPLPAEVDDPDVVARAFPVGLHLHNRWQAVWQPPHALIVSRRDPRETPTALARVTAAVNAASWDGFDDPRLRLMRWTLASIAQSMVAISVAADAVSRESKRRTA